MPPQPELAFSGDGLTPERWRTILDTDGLQKLVIWGGSLGTQDLEPVAALKSLRTLVLGEMKIDDGVFAYIRNLTNLENLYLAYTGVCKGFGELKSLLLKDIRLEGSRLVGDEAMEQLADIATLRQLEVHMTAVTDKGVKAIAKLPLEVLWLGPCITDESMKTISGIATLRHLDLCAPGISDVGVRLLPALPKLQVLWLSNTRISDAIIETLAGMRSLRELALGGTGVTSEGKARLAAALPLCHFVPEPS